MFADAFTCPKAGSSVRAYVHGLEILRSTTPNTSILTGTHGHYLLRMPWRQAMFTNVSHLLMVNTCCITPAYSPHLSHNPCLWHWFSRYRVNSAKSSPCCDATPCPLRDGVFYALKQQSKSSERLMPPVVFSHGNSKHKPDGGQRSTAEKHDVESAMLEQPPLPHLSRNETKTHDDGWKNVVPEVFHIG